MIMDWKLPTITKYYYYYHPRPAATRHLVCKESGVGVEEECNPKKLFAYSLK